MTMADTLADRLGRAASAAVGLAEDGALSAEEFRVAYDAMLRADPATHLEAVARLFGERLPHGAIRTLEIAAAALRAAEPTEAQREAWRDEVERIVEKLVREFRHDLDEGEGLSVDNAIDAISGAGLRMLALRKEAEGGA
jgi:hypothetical protein